MPYIAELFAKKAAPLGSVLGVKKGGIAFDEDKNCLFQLFEHGVVIGKFDAAKLSQLTCTYGQLFNDWWGNPGAEWLGEPLEDLYETTNRDCAKIMVQRFERGVIWCQSDGSAVTRWLSWRDWNAISKPDNNSDKHR